MPTKAQLLALGVVGSGGVAGVAVPLTYKYLGSSSTKTSKTPETHKKENTDDAEKRLQALIKDKTCHIVVKGSSKDLLLACQATIGGRDAGQLTFFYFNPTTAENWEKPVSTWTFQTGLNDSKSLELNHTGGGHSSMTGINDNNLSALNGQTLSTTCTGFETHKEANEQEKTSMVCGSHKYEVTKLDSSSIKELLKG